MLVLEMTRKTLLTSLILFDCSGSYGSTVRYKSVERLKSVGKSTVLGASGEVSDFQAIMQMLDQLM
jgi:20S proteasome subunit beta 7